MDAKQFAEKYKGYFKEEVLQENPELETAISEDVEAVITEAYKGLKTNKEQLYNEKKELQTRFEELSTKAKGFLESGLAWDELQQTLKEYEELKEKGMPDNPDVKQLQEQYYNQGKTQMQNELAPKIKELSDQVDKYKTVEEKLTEKYIKQLRDTELQKVFSKLHIDTDDYWLAGFKSSVDVDYIETEDRVSIEVPHPSDPSLGKIPLRDWAKIFPTTEIGARMIKIPANTGSGALGSDGKPLQGTEDLGKYLNGMFPTSGK